MKSKDFGESCKDDLLFYLRANIKRNLINESECQTHTNFGCVCLLNYYVTSDKI